MIISIIISSLTESDLIQHVSKMISILASVICFSIVNCQKITHELPRPRPRPRLNPFHPPPHHHAPYPISWIYKFTETRLSLACFSIQVCRSDSPSSSVISSTSLPTTSYQSPCFRNKYVLQFRRWSSSGQLRETCKGWSSPFCPLTVVLSWGEYSLRGNDCVLCTRRRILFSRQSMKLSFSTNGWWLAADFLTLKTS